MLLQELNKLIDGLLQVHRIDYPQLIWGGRFGPTKGLNRSRSSRNHETTEPWPPAIWVLISYVCLGLPYPANKKPLPMNALVEAISHKDDFAGDGVSEPHRSEQS